MGRYGVELPEFERLLAEELRQHKAGADLIVIDEIGKMECYSSVFVQTVRELLDGSTPLLATVAQRGTGLIREVKDRKNVEVMTVGRRIYRRQPSPSARQVCFRTRQRAMPTICVITRISLISAFDRP